MGWIIKEILLASILGMFIIILFAKLHVWLHIKINVYNYKKSTNNLTNHKNPLRLKQVKQIIVYSTIGLMVVLIIAVGILSIM